MLKYYESLHIIIGLFKENFRQLKGIREKHFFFV